MRKKLTARVGNCFVLFFAALLIFSPCRRSEGRVDAQDTKSLNVKLKVVGEYRDPRVQEIYDLVAKGFTPGVTKWEEVLEQDRALKQLWKMAESGDSDARRVFFEILLMPDDVIFVVRLIEDFGHSELARVATNHISQMETDYPDERPYADDGKHWRNYARWKLRKMGVSVEGEATAPPEIAGLPADTPVPLRLPKIGEFADPEVVRCYQEVAKGFPGGVRSGSIAAKIPPVQRLLWLSRAGSVEAKRALYAMILLPNEILWEGREPNGAGRVGVARMTIMPLLERHDSDAPNRFGDGDRKAALANWRTHARKKLVELGVVVDGE